MSEKQVNNSSIYRNTVKLHTHCMYISRTQEKKIGRINKLQCPLW